MSKSLKKGLIASLVFLFALLLSLSIYSTPSFATTDTTVSINSLQLRTVSDEKGDYGIRFIAKITNYDSGLTYGMDIVPEDLKEDSTKYAEVVATPTENGGVYTYECALTDIHAANRSRPYTAKPFVKNGSDKEYVGNWAEAKSIYTIATQSLADQSYDKEGVLEYLETIVNTVHGVNSNLNGKYVYKTLTVNGEDVTSFDKKFIGESNFNTVVKMVKEGDSSKVLTAYPVVTLTDAEDQAISGVLTQVDAYGKYKLATDSLGDFNVNYSIGSSDIATIEDCDMMAYKAQLNQDGSIKLDGMQSGNHFTSAWCDGKKMPYYAIEGDYGVGTYIDITFKGNNMPYVCFFADNINGHMGPNGGKGVMFFNGVKYTGNETDAQGKPIEGSYWRGGQLLIYGPNRMSSLNYNDQGDMNWFANGYRHGVMNNESVYKLTQMGLISNGADKNYKLTIGTQDQGGYLVIDITFIDDDTKEILYRAYELIGRTKIATEGLSGNIILYSNLKAASSSSNRFTTFKVSEPYYNEVNVQGATFNLDGSVTLAAGNNGSGQFASTGFGSGASSYKNNYIAFKDVSKVGNYIDFYFTGNNMPQVTMFANAINTCMGASTQYAVNASQTHDNFGYLIANGLRANGTSYLENVLRVHGPDRIADNLTVLKSSNVNFVGGTYTGLDANTNYKYTVGSQIYNEKVAIVVELYNADTNDLLCRGVYDTEKTKTEAEALGSHIIAYAGVKGSNVTTTFKCGEVYNKTVVIPAIQGATYNADGSVTLAPGTHSQVSLQNGAFWSGGWGSGISVFKNNYVAFENVSEVGNYVDFYFTGNNMPQVTLFARDINTCMGASTTSTTSGAGAVDNYGYLIANGLYAANNNVVYGDGMLYVYGENRIHTTLAQITYSNSNMDTVSGAYTGLTDGTNYKYTVGSKLVSDKVVIEVLLYTVDGTTETLVYSATYATNKTETEAEAVGTHIIAYAGVKGGSLSTTFKYSDVYAKNA